MHQLMVHLLKKNLEQLSEFLTSSQIFFIANFYFIHLNRVMIKGSKEVITENDLWNPDEDQLAESESAKLEKVWQPLANQ